MIDCTFCAELSSGSDRAQWNQPLAETDHLVVVPSLGSLVAGWVLIVPKEHHLSMGAMPIELQNEVDALEQRIKELLHLEYRKPVVAFEHGPSAAKHGTGCGVDHAHLHLVPTDCDVLRHALPLVPGSTRWSFCGEDNGWAARTQAYKDGQDYLYLRPDGEEGIVGVCGDFGSQIFRRAISIYLGKEGEFNWRAYPRIEIVLKTIERLGPALTA